MEPVLRRADALFGQLADVVRHPLAQDTPRFRLSLILAGSSLDFAAASRLLCVSKLLPGAATTLRSQFEALVRAVWVQHCASDEQITRLLSEPSLESQRATKNMPLANDMMQALAKVQELANLLIALDEFKASSWTPLNSFVHAGVHAVHWTRFEPPAELIDQSFRASNGLGLLAFQCLGVLTGIPGIQRALFSVASQYPDCLPRPRVLGAVSQ